PPLAPAAPETEAPAAGPAAVAAPRVNLEGPHAGEEHARVLRIHRDVRAARVLVDEQRARPGLAAVGRAIHAALLLRSIGVAHRTREGGLRILRMHDHPDDAAGLFEPEQRPGLAGVHRSEERRVGKEG